MTVIICLVSRFQLGISRIWEIICLYLETLGLLCSKRVGASSSRAIRGVTEEFRFLRL